MLTDHAGIPHGDIEITRTRIIPFDLVGDDVAAAEGEGYADADDWRAGHARFWDELADLVREDAGDPDWVFRSSEPVLVVWFRLL